MPGPVGRLLRRLRPLVWVFAHRFQAEFNVAALLAPFLLAAPDYDVQLLLATQVADEHRHIEAVGRVYSDVFGVEGGIEAVKALADAQLDPVAAALYAALDDVVRALETSRDEDSSLRAVVATTCSPKARSGVRTRPLPHSSSTGSARSPGCGRRSGSRCGTRCAISASGVSYTRRRLTCDGAPARAVIEEIVEAFHALGNSLPASAAPGLVDRFVGAYGADPVTLWAEVLRQLRLRRTGAPVYRGVEPP